MPDPTLDGITHINLYTRGKTRLGRLLTNLADIPLEHPLYGSFRTAEGLWYYLTTGMRHESLRALDGFSAKRLGQTLEKVWFDQFQDHFRMGLRCKIEQHDELKMLFIESTLPFEHYYVYASKDPSVKPKVVNLTKHAWQIDYLTQLRQELRSHCP